jgi:hypothetical protein
MLSIILLALIIKLFKTLREVHLTRKILYSKKIKYSYSYEYDHVYNYVYDNIDKIILDIESEMDPVTKVNIGQLKWSTLNDYIQNNKFEDETKNYIDSFINLYGNNFNSPDIDYVLDSGIDSNYSCIDSVLDYKIRIGKYLMGGANFKRPNKLGLIRDNTELFCTKFQTYDKDYDFIVIAFNHRKSILELLEDLCFLLEYDTKYKLNIRKIRIQLTQLLLLFMNWY